MNKNTVSILFAMLVVLAGTTLRKTFATDGNSNQLWAISAIGISPVPPANLAVGTSPVVSGKLAIGGSPMPPMKLANLS